MKTEQGPYQGGKAQDRRMGKKNLKSLFTPSWEDMYEKKKKKLAEKCYQELNKLNCVDRSVCCF